MIHGAAARLAAVVCLLAAATPVVAAIGIHEEEELGARFALEARRALPLVREPAVGAYLQRVGARLVAELPDRTFTYRFIVVRDPSLNAFAVPGGWVYVHTGLIDRVRTESELAGVLAHEIVHAAAHHAARQQEKTALINYGALLGSFLTIIHPALGASALAAGQAAVLKYQREFEQEADHVGFDLLAGGGFDPNGMPAFLRMVEREQQANPTQVPPYFLSHPLTSDRVVALEERARKAGRGRPRPDGDVELAIAQAAVRALTEPRERVLATYRERLVREPENAEAAHLLGVVYLTDGEAADAEPLLARAVAAGRPRARGDLGRALARLGRHAEARAAFEAHLREHPDDAPIQQALGLLLLEGGDAPAAEPVLERALALDDQLDDAEYGLGECAAKRGDARAQWWHLGRAFELRGDYARAINAYARARDVSGPGTPERKDAEDAIVTLREVREPVGP